MTLQRAFWWLLAFTLACGAWALLSNPSDTPAPAASSASQPKAAPAAAAPSTSFTADDASVTSPDATPTHGVDAVVIAEPAAEPADDAACRLPPRVARDTAPLQSAVPDDFGAPRLEDARLQPLAGFSVEARVLRREDYHLDREARYAPIDLALGWGRMREEAVLDRLPITQAGRWYRYRWEGAPPLPPEEIVRSSANMHMIPADARIAQALRQVRKDQHIRIDGWLVEVQADDGWRWRSSLTREDSGQGACEVVYVCSVRLLASP